MLEFEDSKLQGSWVFWSPNMGFVVGKLWTWIFSGNLVKFFFWSEAGVECPRILRHIWRAPPMNLPRIEGTFTVESPADTETIQQLKAAVDAHCPVKDMLQAVPMEITLNHVQKWSLRSFQWPCLAKPWFGQPKALVVLAGEAGVEFFHPHRFRSRDRNFKCQSFWRIAT